MSESVSPRVWQLPDGRVIREIPRCALAIHLVDFATQGTCWIDNVPADAVELVPVSRVEALEAELAEANAAPSLPTPDAEDPAQLRFVAAAVNAWVACHNGYEGHSALAIPMAEGMRRRADRIEAERAEKAAHDTLIEQVAEKLYESDCDPRIPNWTAGIGGDDNALYLRRARALDAAFNITPKHGEA